MYFLIYCKLVLLSFCTFIYHGLLQLVNTLDYLIYNWKVEICFCGFVVFFPGLIKPSIMLNMHLKQMLILTMTKTANLQMCTVFHFICY